MRIMKFLIDLLVLMNTYIVIFFSELEQLSAHVSDDATGKSVNSPSFRSVLSCTAKTTSTIYYASLYQVVTLYVRVTKVLEIIFFNHCKTDLYKRSRSSYLRIQRVTFLWSSPLF